MSAYAITPETGGGRRNASLLEYVVLAVTLALIILFSIFVQGFATLGNLRVIASNSAALVILSCGMGMVVISRGLDLSLVATMVAGATTFALSVELRVFLAARIRSCAARRSGALRRARGLKHCSRQFPTIRKGFFFFAAYVLGLVGAARGVQKII